MRHRLLAPLGVLLLGPAAAGAQTLTIDHQPAACATVDRYPRLEARFSTRETLAVARVVFQGQTTDWYSVAMKAEGAAFAGILPKPKKDLKSFRYYIEVTDKNLGTSRTPEYTTTVVDSSSACKGKIMAGALASASVLLQGPAGVVAIPAGFATSGVVAAGSAAGSSATAAGAAAGGGGGLSTGAIVGIVAGAGAAAAGVAVAAGGGEDKGAGTSYSGTLNGQYILTDNITAPGPGGAQVTTSCAYTNSLGGSVKLSLGQSSSNAEGFVEGVVSERLVSRSGTTCGSLGPGSNTDNPFNCQATGGPGNFSCSQSRTNTFQGVTSTYSFSFSGSLSGSVISGTLTYSLSGTGGGTNSGGAFTQSFNGSATIPVTLR